MCIHTLHTYIQTYIHTSHHITSHHITYIHKYIRTSVRTYVNTYIRTLHTYMHTYKQKLSQQRTLTKRNLIMGIHTKMLFLGLMVCWALCSWIPGFLPSLTPGFFVHCVLDPLFPCFLVSFNSWHINSLIPWFLGSFIP